MKTMQIKTLKDLQKMPVMVRSDFKFLGTNIQEHQVVRINFEERTYIVKNPTSSKIPVTASFEDSQLLTPIESPKYKGEHIAIGDWVTRRHTNPYNNDTLSQVYGYQWFNSEFF